MMNLPEITLPKVALPFDIPVLLHPAVDHFAIALPVVVLLIEFYNLFARRKTVGGFSFILLVLTVVVFAAAVLTGSTDGKEAYTLLSPEGQAELKAHKLLGTYLLFGSAALLVFKFLAMTGKGLFKFLFFLVLIGFILLTFKQGKEGGELVYEYGANIERAKSLKDDLSDVKEELEGSEEEAQESKKSEEKPQVVAPAVQPSPVIEESKQVEEVKEVEKPVVPKEATIKTTTDDTTQTVLETVTTEVQETNEKVIETLKDTAKETVIDIKSTPVETSIH